MAHHGAGLPPPAAVVPIIGNISILPPTFLERWGVVFVAVAGTWVLLASSVLLYYFLQHQPPSPDLSAKTSDQAMQSIGNYRLVYEQWRDSLSYIFDLLVTKTALPLVTLLLGYLFGRHKP